MKHSKTIAKIALLFAFILSFNNLIGQNQPIQVTSFIKPPYPMNFEDWNDFSSKIMLSLVNQSTNDYEINLKLNISGPNGLNVLKENLLNYPMELSAFQSKTIQGPEWEQFGISLDFEDIMPESERNYIIQNRAFREGDFNICIQAVNAANGTPLSDSYPSGCFNFDVVYGEAPEIINPYMDQVVQSQEPSLISINWIHQVQGAPFEYTLKIIEVNPSIAVDINQAMNNPGYPSFYEEEEILGFSKIIRNEDFKEGFSYAMRITARDAYGEVFFKNAGQSDIIIFKYGAALDPNCMNLHQYAMKAHFPANGDTLPFISMPLEGEFLPNCKDFEKLKITSTFNASKKKDIQLLWPDGALKYIQDGLNDPNVGWSMASQLPLLESTSTLERGKSYTWSASTVINDKNGQAYNSNTGQSTFVCGMPKPRLNTPAADEKVDAGLITFYWKSVQGQKRLLPEFKSLIINDVNGKKTSRRPLIQNINEHWVLQVFSEDKVSNDKLVGQKDGKLTLDLDDYYNISDHKYQVANLINELSSELSAEIEINKEGDYWWRVIWLKNPNSGVKSISESNIYHTSHLQKFHVGPQYVPFSDTGSACFADCDAPEVSDKNATGGLKVDQVLKIGLFDLKINHITKSSNNTYDGNGEIKVGFINTNVLVEFKGLQKNQFNQVFAGTAKATQDKYFKTALDDYLKFVKGLPAKATKDFKGTLMSVYMKLYGELYRLQDSRTNLVLKGAGVSTNALPIGIKKEIEGNKIVIAISEMTFTPRKAILQTLIDVKIPALKINTDSTKVLILGSKDICFGPSGIPGGNAKAFLTYDLKYDLDENTNSIGNKLKIIGGENNTFVTWDCEGFRDFNIKLEYSFPRDVIIPDDENDKGPVIARANLLSTRGIDLMGTITMADFQLPHKQLKGYGFKVSDAWIDLSDYRNPDGLVTNLPTNYQKSLSGTDPRLTKTWRGFWLKKMQVKIPGYIGNVDKNNRTSTVSIDNIIIDNTGFTAALLIKNLIKWEETHTKDTKHIDGCAFSMDSVWINIVQNKLSNAGLSGKIGLPIAEERDYLVYRGLIQNSDINGGIKFSIVPQKDISIPISFATLKVESSSTFNMSLGDNSKSFVEFNIHATASIKGNPINKDDKKSDILNLPKVAIENLKFNSTTGFDTTGFKFKLASPQKWLAGFPVSLKKYSFKGGLKNPKVNFTLALSLMNAKDQKTSTDKGGFAADATISLEGVINTNAELLKMLEVKDVKLEEINLNVSQSGFVLKGGLKFYDENNKNGFKGNLAVKLPMGIKADLNAEFGTYHKKGTEVFNTADWYSYWYVDGFVTSSGGIPVFSGVNMYGLGGGLYHHMKRVTKVATKKGDTSKIPYEPSYDNLLGLKFGALFGSADGGKAFNFDVMLEATFNNSLGMNYFGFTGNANIMTEGPGKESSAVTGYVKFEYNNQIDDIKNVQGKVLIRVATPLIKGDSNVSPPPGYKGKKDNLFVLAQFYAELGDPEARKKNGKWYFHVGTPEKRGALKVDFTPETKDSKNSIDKKAGFKIRFDSYLMVGHDIPSEMPLPNQEFLDIYEEAGGKKDFKGGKTDFKGGKVNTLIGGQKRPTLPLGTGFAFGSSFSARIDANPIPFYFSGKAALGFDINMTQNSDRVCSQTQNEPGIDGWYSTGQIYAGLSIGVGIKVDLLFIKGKFSIFDGAAAMIMQGGFPDPNWAEGEGHVNYKILNGLFKGHYFFVFALGQKCTSSVRSSEYLASINFIQDIKPGTGSKDVNVFTECTATFALPLDKRLEIPVDNENIKIFKPKIHEWSLKEADSGTKVKCKMIYLDKEKVNGTLSPEVILGGNTRYSQELVVRVDEYLNKNWTPVFDKNNNHWSEKKTHSFVTGEAPAVIIDENVEFTYPLHNQRTFFKGETVDQMGYIVQSRGSNKLFSDQSRDYVARFTKLDGSDNYFDTPLDPDETAKVIKFSIENLVNDQYYALQIISKKRTGLSDLVINGGPVDPYFEEYQSDNLLLGGRNYLTSEIIKKRKLPGNSVRNNDEILLYHYYFKTSKYNTFRNKVSACSWTANVQKGFWGTESFNAQTTIDEGFELYDKEGYKKRNCTVPALVSLGINDGRISGISNDNSYTQYPLNLYIDKKVNPMIRVPIDKTNDALKKSRIDERVNFSGFTYDTAIKWTSKTQFASPISKDEMNFANNLSLDPSANSSGLLLNEGLGNTASPFVNLGLGGSGVSGLGNLNIHTVEINDQMPVYGPANYDVAKYAIARVLAVELPLFDQNNIPTHFLKYMDPDFWVHKYVGYPELDVKKWTYYTNIFKDKQPTIKDFLFSFYPLEASLAHQLATYPASQMKPPDRNSFIMQYHFPVPYISNNTTNMNGGTSIQVIYEK